MNSLKEKYDFHEDSFSLITKFLEMNFPKENSLVEKLNNARNGENTNFLNFCNILENSQIFPSFIDLNRRIAIDSEVDRRAYKDIDDMIIFAKTFYICEEYEQIYKEEVLQLKLL